MRLLKQFTFILITFININLYAQLDASKVDSISFYLSKVMITANRYEKNVFETNIPVNMVHEKEIWQQGVDNLGDILQQKAGVTFSSAGPWSQKMIIRGLAGPQVLTLIDGMRLEVLRSYGSHAPLIDVNQIERVEIIRGPASILYGSDAIAGVINFITKKTPITNSGFILNGNIGLQYCSNNQQYNEHIKLSTSYRNWSFLIGYNNRKAEDINTPQGKLSNSGFKGYTIDTKIGFQPAKQHYLRLPGKQID